MTTVQFGSSSHFRQWNLHGNTSKTPCIGQVSIATVQSLLWLKSYSFHVFVKKSTKMPWSLIMIKDGWKGVKTSATHPLLWTLHNQHELYVTTRGGSRIFREGGQLKKWGQLAHLAPNSVLQPGIIGTLGPISVLVGPLWDQKYHFPQLDQGTFTIKFNVLAQKVGAFFCRGGGQSTLVPRLWICPWQSYKCQSKQNVKEGFLSSMVQLPAFYKNKAQRELLLSSLLLWGTLEYLMHALGGKVGKQC